ncbi:MAG: glutathione-dependent formaldehyde dehydrogenase, partial [Rhodosalinus sp.]
SGPAFIRLGDGVVPSVRRDHPGALSQAILSCRKGGRVVLPGVYEGAVDDLPLGAAMSKGLTIRMGRPHVHRYMRPLLEAIGRGELDASFIVSHRLVLADAPAAYELLGHEDGVKVVLEA